MRAGHGHCFLRPNLAYLQSFQAGCRVITPWIANYLFSLSLGGKYGTPGALPFLGTALLALLTALVPLLLTHGARRRPGPRRGQRAQRQRGARRRKRLKKDEARVWGLG